MLQDQPYIEEEIVEEEEVQHFVEEQVVEEQVGGEMEQDSEVAKNVDVSYSFRDIDYRVF